MNYLFIVGAQRSGTTYLYHLLQNHPQVSLAAPVRPEPKFFLNDDLYKRGRTFYENIYFNDYLQGTRYLGEKSTSYIESTVSAERIAEYYPHSRILIMLRNPVFRAYSNYVFSLQHGLETLNFDQALSEEHQRILEGKHGLSVNPFAYRKRGYYIDYIQEYLKIFDREQICVLIFEEFINNVSEVQKLYSWLGIDKSYIPGCLGDVFNASNMHKTNENHIRIFRELAEDYQESLLRLEEFLDRKIEVWRQQWARL